MQNTSLWRRDEKNPVIDKGTEIIITNTLGYNHMTTQNKTKEALISQSDLKKLFTYCTKSGNLIRLTNTKRSKIGAAAGCINVKGYRVIRINGEQYYGHRLVWLYHYGEFPTDQIDHIGRDRADNRIERLRDVTNQQNRLNNSKRSDNASGVTGVSWNKMMGKWVVQIYVENRNKVLGYFDCFKSAVETRKSAELRYGYTNG